MIYGAETFKYKTLGEMVRGAGIDPAAYNWLISDSNIFIRSGEQDIFGEEYTWLSGEGFAEMIQNDGYYFIWCMASAFPRSVTLEAVLSYDLPYANGNGDFWVNDVKLQTPLSKIELVIFDGYSGFVLSDDVRHRDNFLAAFPEAFDLVEDNKISNARIEVIRGVIKEVGGELGTNKPEWGIYRGIFGGLDAPEDMKEIYEQCREALGERGLLAKTKGDMYL